MSCNLLLTSYMTGRNISCWPWTAFWSHYIQIISFVGKTPSWRRKTSCQTRTCNSSFEQNFRHKKNLLQDFATVQARSLKQWISVWPHYIHIFSFVGKTPSWRITTSAFWSHYIQIISFVGKTPSWRITTSCQTRTCSSSLEQNFRLTKNYYFFY